MSVGDLAPYDEEDIQLMDTDGTNLQLEEQTINQTTTDVVSTEKQEENNNIEKDTDKDKIPSLFVIEKLKVYIRDGQNSHHVEAIPVDSKYYELASFELTEKKLKDI